MQDLGRVLSIQMAIIYLLGQGPGTGSRAWWGKGSYYQQLCLLKIKYMGSRDQT